MRRALKAGDAVSGIPRLATATGVLLAVASPHAPPPLGLALALLAGLLGGPLAVASASVSTLLQPGLYPLAALLGYAASRGPWGLAAGLLASGLALAVLSAGMAAPGWRGPFLALTAATLVALSSYGRPPRPLRLPRATPRRLIYLAGALLALAAVAAAEAAWGLPGAAVAGALVAYAALQGPNHLVYASLSLLLVEAWLEPQVFPSLEASLRTSLGGP